MGAAPQITPTERVAEFRQDLRARRSRGRPRYRRPSGRRPQGPDRAVRGRPRADRRRPRARQNPDGQDRRRRAGPQLQAHPVHARPDALGYRRHPGADRDRRPARVPLQGRSDFRARRARRRDQPRHAQDPIRGAGGDGGAASHGLRHDLSARAAVLRASDAEPDRTRGHLSAARGADGPLSFQGRDGFAQARGVARNPQPHHRATTISRNRSFQ